VRLSHKSETVSQKWDCLTFLWQCGQGFSVALVDSVSLRPPLPCSRWLGSSVQHGAKTINNDCQALGLRLLDMREIVRIIATKIVRIDLLMRLWSEPYLTDNR